MRAVSCLSAVVVAAAVLTVSAQAQNAQRFVRFEQAGNISWGELVGETVHRLSGAPYAGGSRTGASVALSNVTLKAPVDPQQIFMTAFNFRSHISGDPAEYPGIFLVPPSSIIGPGENIVRPAESRNLHYEAEAVAVIGRVANNISLEDAGSYIFGVSAGNDVSERAWQAQDIQWSRAKGSKTFNAVGPYLVTGLDPRNLAIEGRHNGTRVQGENTSDLIFSLEFMVHYISQYFTLYPGDLVWTGTMGSTRAMSPGDTYEVEIPGVGILRNSVVQGM
ncbi:MAG: fumarylacetoacetate hydrolase family protein [Gemmatimonadota bacterium]|nr:fumarylacetoacetate hydrolase family protein [Gemmatimonadota bacterium]MDH3421643.1 fumarylacetoacetate hydrolase family protein [Gemmatimonadota bacterium]